MPASFSRLPANLVQCRKYIHNEINQLLEHTYTFNGQRTAFLPANHLATATQDRVIQHLLTIDTPSNNLSPAARMAFFHLVKRSARKMCIAFFYSGLSMANLYQVIHGSSPLRKDADLPFLTNVHPMTPDQYQRVSGHQYLFLAPVFIKGQFHLSLAARVPIPIDFSTKSGTLGGGAGGKVFSAEVHNEHHQIPGLTQPFALKQIVDVRSAQRERHVLELFANTAVARNPHVAKIYAGFRLPERTYLIAEKLQGNLNELMKENLRGSVGDRASLSKPWFLSQLRGLADALAQIHSVPGQSVCHRDIKPDNILYQETRIRDRRKQYTFKITDWGCATGDNYTNRKQSSPRNIAKGSPPYNPPEARKGQSSSRKHDVWALGCVYLELLIWYTGGYAALMHFRTARESENDEDFCQQDNPKKLVGEVRTQLSALESISGREWARQVRTIRRMLTVEKTRLTAAQVSIQIR